MHTNEGHPAITILLHLKAVSAAFGLLCIIASPLHNTYVPASQLRSHTDSEGHGAYLWWGLELCPELCQLGLELPQMILSGLQNPQRC